MAANRETHAELARRAAELRELLAHKRAQLLDREVPGHVLWTRWQLDALEDRLKQVENDCS